jgi:N-methylhydantoinase A
VTKASHLISRCRIGIDVGGTFTDLVLANPKTGQLHFYKEPSTPNDPSEAVERGTLGIMERAQVRESDIELVVHGTTLGLNTIIQRKGAKVALIVSRGNRDVFEIARCRMPSSYDLSVGKEEPLVSRDLVFEIPARTRADGIIEERPSAGDLQTVARTLAVEGVGAAAIMLLHSYAYPELENEVAQILRELSPNLLVTQSAQLWPEIREYERALVAALNAHIHPLLDSYFLRLERRLQAIGVRAPIYITASNGGTVGLATARERPIDTVLSGPASGVVAASRLAASCGIERIISFDMGGTSSDMAVTRGGKPEYTTRTTVGDFPLMLPVVNVSAIGAGGGSVVWVDPQGVLKVGPRSAGASPGPICYQQGGQEPTITDCYLALGYLRPDGFLGGRITLDRDAAIASLDDVAKQLDFGSDDAAPRAAEAALKIATAKMATELHKAFAQRGLDPREFSLIAYGGAGPTQASFLAEEIRLIEVIIPLSPGTLCALGAVVSDLKRDYVRTIRLRADDRGAIGERLNEAMESLKHEAGQWIEGERELVGEARISWTADARYTGEGHELSFDVTVAMRNRVDVDAIIEAFHQVHDAVYGFRDPDTSVEVMAIRAQVVGMVPSIKLPQLTRGPAAARATQSRRVFLGGEWREVPVYRRTELNAGNELSGPAVIEQEDTTVLILAGWTGRVDEGGNLRLGRK